MTEKKDRLFGFQWHITNRCNLRCAHCYQDDYSGFEELDLDRLKQFAKEIVRTLSVWGKKGDIAVTGGEPLLRDDVFSLVDYLMAFKEVATVDLLTNGTLVSEEIAHKLGRLKKLRCVQVSLDGASAECHDAIRGKGSFDRALSGIQLLRTNRVQVNIMFTLQRGNLREIGSIIDLATNQGVRFLTIERFVPAGAGSKTRSNVLSSEEIRSAFEYISMRADQQIAERGSTIITRSRPLWVLCDGDLMTDASERCNLGGICSLGIDGLCILPNGVVLPCRRLPIPIGDLKTDSITKIWHTSKLLYEIADKRNLKGKCKGCDLIGKCSGCRAMAFAITGDYLAEDPQCFKYK